MWNGTPESLSEATWGSVNPQIEEGLRNFDNKVGTTHLPASTYINSFQ